MALYHQHNMTLPQIMVAMESKYGVSATAKMYRTRFRRWGLWKHLSESVPNCRLHASDELQNEEMVYRALRDYYNSAFTTQRWAFEGDRDQLAITHTEQAIHAGEEIYSRFQAAMLMLERPSHGNNGGKTGDFAQGVRLMRISFAKLPRFLCSGSSCKPPLLPLWMMYIMALFHKASVRDFRPVERQLLRHLHELTISPTYPRRPLHPTALLWHALWLGVKRHKSSAHTTMGRHHLGVCTAIAVKHFSQHISPFHPQTVELRGLAIGLIHPNSEGNPDNKTPKFRDLLHDLEAHHPVYDLRHIVAVCCWASHYRHHSTNQNRRDMLEEGISLLEDILRDPAKARAIDKYPKGAFNIYWLLANMSWRLDRFDVAEHSIRHATALARRHWAATGENGDLFKGLNGLEVILRAQGKVGDADAVQEERKRLVHDALEMVGEKEDSMVG